MIILLMLALDAGIPLGLLTLVFILKKEKYMWLVPVAVIIINAIYVFNNILSLYANKSLTEKIRLYFVNDSSMGLYIIHIPMVLLSILFTLCFIMASKYIRIKKEH